MKQSSAFLKISVSLVFLLCKDTKDPEFKEMQKLIKTSAPYSGLIDFESFLWFSICFYAQKIVSILFLTFINNEKQIVF